MQRRTSYTLAEYCDRYLEMRRAKKEVAETTIGKQEWQFKAVCHHIGHVKLEEVTPRMLNDVYVAMMQGDTLSGRKSGGSYVNQIHDNITLVFQHAIKEGILVSNPCDKADPPKMDTKPKKAIHPDKVRELVAELDPTDPHECAYLLAVTLGLRRGEICGLSWNDIDFERNIVDISHSYDNLGNLKGTKIKAGMRLLPLSPVTKDALLKMKEAQAAQFAKTNSFRKPEEGYLEQTEDGPVIAGHYGERVQSGTMSRWWSVDRKEFGLEGYTLHELRHTYLTMLAMQRVSTQSSGRPPPATTALRSPWTSTRTSTWTPNAPPWTQCRSFSSWTKPQTKNRAWLDQTPCPIFSSIVLPSSIGPYHKPAGQPINPNSYPLPSGSNRNTCDIRA